LARDLIERAEQDEGHPIPVVFNLSSWAEKQRPLQEWLVHELMGVRRHWVLCLIFGLLFGLICAIPTTMRDNPRAGMLIGLFAGCAGVLMLLLVMVRSTAATKLQ
jgi:hypothetical protein